MMMNKLDKVFPDRMAEASMTPAFAQFVMWQKRSTALLNALKKIQDDKKAYWIACDHVRKALFGEPFYPRDKHRDQRRVYRLVKILEKNGSLKVERKWITVPGAIGKQRVIYLHTEWSAPPIEKRTSHWKAFLNTIFGDEE